MSQERTVSPGAGATTRGYRPELQGLRALAVLLVVVYHVWLGRVSGGVDVFFVVSGFLLTGQVLRSAGRGRLGFARMWGRMIKRLFPAALTVLLVTMAVGVLVLPQLRWLQTIREVVASALYAENWRLAADATDYFAQHNSASVVQHFWSLSIQGQFFVAWPLLIAGLVLLARRAGLRAHAVVATGVGVLFAASLAYSVWLTAVNQPLAYFHSLTRVWEFALGGLLALVIDRAVLPRVLGVVLGWFGVLALIACGLVLRVGTVFPGYAALWPTLAAAAILLAGATGSPFGADRWLSSRPLEYLGNLSYALYLWHWPVLLYYLVVWDVERPPVADGVLVIAVAVLLSVPTYHLIEKAARDSRIGVRSPWGAYRFGVLLLIPVLLVATGWQVLSERETAAAAITLDDPAHPGAVARTAGYRPVHADVPLAPSMVALPDDWARIDPRNCTSSPRDRELELCATTVRGTPQRRIVIVGDSHIQQYIAALRPAAERNNWQLIAMLKGACPFSTDADAMPGDRRCMDWNAAAAAEIIDLRPDAVLTLASRDVRPGLTERTPPGFVAQWRKLDAAGIPVLAVRDNPRPGFTPSECVSRHGKDSRTCAVPRATVLAARPPYERIPDVPRNVSFMDFSDYICTERECPAVIGNVLVYLDNNHLSATFASTMSTIVRREIGTALGW